MNNWYKTNFLLIEKLLRKSLNHEVHISNIYWLLNFYFHKWCKNSTPKRISNDLLAITQNISSALITN